MTAAEKTVGKRIAKLRELFGMKQDEVAKALGVDRPAVSAWETGRRIPGRKRLFSLAKLFRVTAEYILLGAGEQEAEAPTADPSGMERASQAIVLPVYESVGPGAGGFSRERVVGMEVVAMDEVRDGHYFFYRVSGDAMAGKIEAGYTALVKEGSQVSDGDVVLASVNAEDAVLRRYRRSGGMVVLQADNPAYAPIVVPPENVRILGKVQWVKFYP